MAECERNRTMVWRTVTTQLIACVVGGSLLLTSCANSPLGSSVERSLAADPSLTESSEPDDSSESPESNPANPTATNAEAPSSTPADPNSPPRRSNTNDPPVAYRPPSSPQTDDPGGTTDPEGTDDPVATAESTSPLPPSQSFTDLEAAPVEIQPYLMDLAALGVLTPANAETQTFAPNQTITRRTFARWLVTTNNALFSDRPAYRIRQATTSTQPVFQDMPASDPDFAIIQGLAEAGLVPSPLSGVSETVNFRPDAPLTRQDLLRWKVPLDLRRPLPTASVDAVQETWGFQDATQIDPDALRAILADYNSGSQANIRRAFGYTTLLQPQRSVTRAEAASVLWYFGYQGDGLSASDALQLRSPSDTASDSPSNPAPETP